MSSTSKPARPVNFGQPSRHTNLPIRWISALTVTSIFYTSASHAQSTEDNRPEQTNSPSFVREFSDSQKSFIKEFGFNSFKSPEQDNDPEALQERARQAEQAFKKKLTDATLPESFDIAVRYHHQGDLEKAVAFYRRVLEENPKYEPAYNNLALCLTERKAAGDLEEAKELLSQSQKLSADDAAASTTQSGEDPQANTPKKVLSAGGRLFAEGQLSEQSGDLQKAAELYQKALDQGKPINLIIVKHLSDLYVKIGNYTGARVILKRGILSAPPEDHMKILYRAIGNLDNKEKPNKVE